MGRDRRPLAVLVAALAGVSLGMATVLTWSLFTTEPWLVDFNRFGEGPWELVLFWLLGLAGLFLVLRWLRG